MYVSVLEQKEIQTHQTLRDIRTLEARVERFSKDFNSLFE